MGSISAANAEFCFDLFRELKPQHINENIFYSPLSIISALAMVYLGTRGNTALQVEKLENTINFDKLMAWTSSTNMRKRKVEVYLPRMKLEEQYSLAPVLSSLGMTDLFTQSADLSGISTGKNLAVSEVIHKSHVEINEEGTEAAAATGVTIVLMSHVFPIKFKADHPFLFFIHHKKTNLILFYGRFSSP
uniref:Ovalbumin-like n=1 Tax=Crocodylus porosus TaxID=8502 RepID=A0A7M4E6J3_CROPO